MSKLRDRTGTPGPSTWELGSFPEGQDDYPVSGVSWYEASAYAESVGKTLPTIYHWNNAAMTIMSAYIAPLSNFSRTGPGPCRKLPGHESIWDLRYGGQCQRMVLE